MAEKKKGWFSRLFGGKKEEEVTPAAPSPEVVEESVPDAAAEESDSSQDTAPESHAEKTPSSHPAESTDIVADTIVEGISQEIDESIHHSDADDVTKHRDHAEAHTNHSAIKSQHSFLDDIVSEAKEEIEAGHKEIIEPAESTIKETPVSTDHQSEQQAADQTRHYDPAEDHVSVKDVAAEEISLEYQTADIDPEQAEMDEEDTESNDIPDNRADEIEASFIDPVASEVNEESYVEEMPIEDTSIEAEPQFPETISPVVETAVSEEPANTKASDAETQPVEEETSKEELPAENVEAEAVIETSPAIEEAAETPKKKKGFFARLSSKLSKTRNNITEGLADLFLGKKEINEEILEELETRLLMADVGITVTDQMLTSIRDSVSRKSLSNVDELFASLKVQMKDILEPVSKPLVIDTSHKPYVILMIGVNGVGKTTTIGKLAKKFQAEGKSVMLAAGDTFRAAAVEQLEIWGERNKIPVISQKEGADPASVIFDAMESAKARKVDILIADTAGRLHTDSGLMQELGKINRVIKRHDETAPHEVMLVVDASTGQNALNQARQFNETVPLSGITFTKLDGTAKGGIIFAIANELNIPIRFIGVGETIDDLRVFDADEFVDALIETKED